MNKNVIIITTKNDEVISGRYVNENETHIVVYSYNSYISIAKEDIETIYNTSDYKNKFEKIYKNYYKSSNNL